MNFDFAKTLALVKGGLLDSEATWNKYFESCPGWQQTAMVLTGPLLISSVVLSVIFSRLFGTFNQYGYGNFFAALVFGLVSGVLAVLIATLIFNLMAKVFEGEQDFSRAFAAVSLAAIPGWIGTIVGSLIPWLGGIVMLAGGIWTLVNMYKIMPLALKIPDDKRVLHFIVSIVLIIIVNMVINLAIGFKSGMNQAQMEAYQNASNSRSSTSRNANSAPSFVNEIERQGQLMEDASADVYEPPSDGELSRSQVKDYVKVMQKTRTLQEEYAAKMKKLSDDMDAKNKAGESPSISDLTSMFKGVGGAVSAANLEMEVVKTGGGNWAEHQWVKEQLRIAYIQQGEGSDALEHNYKLYKDYEEELDI